jgi:hypothetical protein
LIISVKGEYKCVDVRMCRCADDGGDALSEVEGMELIQN